ncbi:MmoB/DmpM family protein [Halomonas sp. THAF12]|uniref:MmoB/DmpM family protein n=1 Tax=Halomonas sp. B23F22_10 TaxID=3459515 RepID=UPI00373FBB9C
MSRVFIALQDNENARFIVEAVTEDNPSAEVKHSPAMVRIEADDRLTIRRETVEDKLGRDWDTQELQVDLISLGGNVDEDDDSFTLYWNT